MHPACRDDTGRLCSVPMEEDSLKAVVLATALSIAGWSSYQYWNWYDGGRHLAIDPTAIGVDMVYYLPDDGSPLVRPLAQRHVAACMCRAHRLQA